MQIEYYNIMYIMFNSRDLPRTVVLQDYPVLL